MVEIKEGPSYLSPKIKAKAERQFRETPSYLRKKIIHGSPEEAADAIEEIGAMRRAQGKPSLERATIELFGDLRTTASQGRKEKEEEK